MPDPTQTSPQESFRQSLEDVRDIAKRLQPHCKTVSELLQQVEAALDSEPHLALLMSLVLGRK